MKYLNVGDECPSHIQEYCITNSGGRCDKCDTCETKKHYICQHCPIEEHEAFQMIAVAYGL